MAALAALAAEEWPRAHGGGDRGKSPGPERQAAGGGEAQAPGREGLSGQTVGYQGETE